MEEIISISRREYQELKRKAEAYDKISAGGRSGGATSSSHLTPEQRSARAKRAVEARIKKYNQKNKERR